MKQSEVKIIPMEEIVSMYELLHEMGLADEYTETRDWLKDGPLLFEPETSPRYHVTVWDKEKECLVMDGRYNLCHRIIVDRVRFD